MQGKHILRGHYLTPEERRAHPSPGFRSMQDHQSLAEARLWLQRMLKLSGTDAEGPKTALESHNTLNEEDEKAWMQHMLALAADAGQDEKEKEKSHEQLDADLINDFIHHREDFAQ